MDTQSLYKSPAGEKAVLALYDKVLADHWPRPYQTLTIPTRHGHTFVIASGQASGPALVLLHGAASNSAIWAADAAVFQAALRSDRHHVSFRLTRGNTARTPDGFQRSAERPLR